MKHLGLFEGIGGFSLAARWAGWETVAWCEWNPFCQKVLAKNFPAAAAHGDITKTDFTIYADKIDIITGGFPCQPFSRAGSRKGKTDDRYLWPEMLRAIREVRPRWIVGENVPGLIELALEDVFIDLENEGYKIQPFIIPACAIGAAHRRDRVFIIANNERNHYGGANLNGRGQREQEEIISNVWRRRSGDGKWQIEPNICRKIDGIPGKLDTSRLRALGNAVQPQVAYEIFKVINACGGKNVL